MHPAAPMNAPGPTSRRTFLYVLTGTVGVAGVAAALWSLVDYMNPDAATRAASDLVTVDLTDLPPAAQRVVFWHRLPIFVAHRTTAMLDAMRNKAFATRLIDGDSQARQQPAYARNWHRSIDPRYAVLVGVCTACGCVTHLVAEATPDAVIGGYICPCCASRYDPAGRAHAGPARYNLPVPPYQLDARSRLTLGKNPPGELFTLDAVERI
jgi:ubiquinol-cytochrome c reductase iron-sulfur subunit